jgi:hypothetical protein
MTFQNALQAKEFFVSRVVAAARRGNISLSELEVKNLYFTEAGSDAKPEYLEDMAHFEEQFNSNEYEEKISGLLKRAYEHDVKHPQEIGTEDAREAYRIAYEVLSREDHYILIMIQDALGGKVRKKLFGII